MAIELIGETINISRVVGENTFQAMIENELIVPDIKPDIIRVILLDADSYINDAEVLLDKIQINGLLRFKILYFGDDDTQNIKSIQSNAGFSYTLDMPGAQAGMKCAPQCEIEHIDYTLINGRKMGTKTILKFPCKVWHDTAQDIVSDLRGIEEVQIQKEVISINSFIGSASSVLDIKESMEVPAGKPSMREILRTDVKVIQKECNVNENNIYTSGQIEISTLYASDEDEIGLQYMEHEIPYYQSLEIDNLSEDSFCDISNAIEAAQFEILEDHDGEPRILSAQILLKHTGNGFKKRDFEIVNDSYSPKKDLQLDKEMVVFDESFAKNQSQFVLKNSFMLPEGAYELSEVFNVLCKPILSEYFILEDKVKIEGIVRYQVLYLTTDLENPLFCFEQEEFFNHTIDVRGIQQDMHCDIKIEAEHCNYSILSADEIETRVVLGLTVDAIKRHEAPLLVKVTEQPINDKRLASQPSITLYFTQPGDTLWKVAKKHYTTASEILSVNKISEMQSLMPGQQILIPRKAI